MDLFKRKLKRFSWQFVVLSICLLLVPLVMNNCSTSKYDKPITIGTTETPLISPETLKAWIDSGAVNNNTGFGDRVVILDVTTAATYSAGHIPGARLVLTAEINQNRLEGPAADINMVATGEAMDALIQKNGIDKDTTIVFTTGGGASPSILNATRAYWTFRYWGFPKEKLKLVDGVNYSWFTTYTDSNDPMQKETGNPSSPAPSTYSVKNNLQLRTDLRTSLSEMIKAAEANNINPDAVPVVDTRSSATDGSYAGKRGSTPGVFDPGSDFVAFEGRVKGAKALLYTDMLVNPTTVPRFKSAAELASMFNAVNVDGAKTTHVY